MKKTYNQPTCIIIQMAARDAILQTASAENSLGVRFGGNASQSGKGPSFDADVKSNNSYDVWNDDWSN